ncbi:MAG: SDR family NAD(P)-dependent oxidoreductase [Dehalococcoidia bacterium]|nr:SDR family NAD(P)-dependent oxidoreductase [Dehalococcoidia bacterium]
MTGRLEGRVAIITGSGRGIGQGIAKLMSAEGAAVIVNDFGGNLDGTGGEQSPAQETVNAIKAAGGKASPNYGDVSKHADARAMVEQALDEYGRVDIMCHVAGILRDRMVFNMTEEEWDAVLSVHLKGAFNMARASVEPMLKQRYGRMLFFSSGSGLGSSGQANYSAAKEGMVGLARSLARELGPYGIAVNAIYPGGATRMTASVPSASRDLRARAGITGGSGAAAAPRQDFTNLDAAAGTPRDPGNNAPPVTWLCSEAGGMISGQVIGTSGWQASRYSIRQAIRSISAPRRWTVEELSDIVPNHLAAGIINPAPYVQPQEAAAT